MTGRVEALLARLESEVRIPQSFIIPGASPASSAMDLARTVVRRTERAAIALADSGKLANDEVLRYLNRLSDCIFMLARYEDRELPFEALTGDRQ
jgi:cob(I)alamin adenosyltransferase